MIDWAASWWAPYRALGKPLWQSVQEGCQTDMALELVRHDKLLLANWRFVSQAALPAHESYEAFIARSHSVPTRDNLHDFFNGLCWLRFPEIKARLNALQAAEIARVGVQPLRGPVRDALTVFDENAAFLQAPPQLWQALRDRNWQRLFVDLRADWVDAKLVLFGHALLEKLVLPRKAITAHVYLANPPMGSLASLDAWVANDLTPEKLATKPFTPLPVLGVPGWWPDNQAPEFYNDPQVFRPARSAPASG